MTITDGRRSMGGRELLALLALVMSTVALAIDIILPAFGDIRSDFGLPVDSTAPAGLITAFFLGLSASQLVFGLLADRFGRKPVLNVGMGLYVAGALASLTSPDLTWLLVARFVWGVGAGAPRILTLSVLRDTYSGAKMARAMSFVIAIFIIVPVIAPSIGAVLTAWVSWRGALGFTVLFAALLWLWSARLPETLHPEYRISLSRRDVARAWRLVLTNRTTVGYMLAFTALFGGFASYLASSELIFGDIFGLVAEFPLVFGALAILMGAANLANSAMVERMGLEGLIRRAMAVYLAAVMVLTLVAFATGGVPPFPVFAACLAAVLSLYALLIPNINSAAMVPMAAVAGTASAVIGTVTTAVGALIGAAIDRAYDGTVIPLSTAMLVMGLIAWGACRWAAGGSEALDAGSGLDVATRGGAAAEPICGRVVAAVRREE